ncbi:SRPBCC family protein [Nonomuraea sp. NPDC049152]|uniref:SRPBCC family protein n=1 Tax=Nonomuraea sp. NPDC049152 TaxID=3154350 RepID=UPI0033EE8D43
MPTRMAVAVPAEVPAERLFQVLTDWPRHPEWMFLTTAHVVAGDGRGVGSELAAFTGLWRLGFVDTMVITRWEPPTRVAVTHTGLLVRGTGVFRIAGGRLIWAEELTLPLGPLIRPVARAFMRWSLRRLVRLAASHP